MTIKALIFVLSILFIGCGVKGRPLPPESPREIGIGKPQYKGVDQELNSSSEAKSLEDEKD